MTTKSDKAVDFISLSEAAKIRKCSHQAISELVKKGRFKTFMISRHVHLSRKEVLSYEPVNTGRPPKKK
jgi:predicted DNA-binding protein YlxM (UPF0122 family)